MCDLVGSDGAGMVNQMGNQWRKKAYARVVQVLSETKTVLTEAEFDSVPTIKQWVSPT